MTDIKKLLKDFSHLGITTATNATKFNLFTTPFPVVNNLIGGFPKGRFTTLCGPEHTGKGAFCLQLIAYLQAQDPEFICLWTDAEASFDETWAVALGIDLDRLILQRYTSDINTMEGLLDTAIKALKEIKFSMWVIDSIGALLPKDDVYDSKGKDKSLEGAKMLNLQRKLGEFFRKANIFIAPDPKQKYDGCAVLCIAQIYTDINQYVPIDVVKGGNALKHWAHLRLMFKRGPRSDWPEPVKIMSADGVVREVFPGWSGRVKIEKTRINTNEGKEILLPFRHGIGFDSRESVINSAFGLHIIERSGPNYKFELFPNGLIKGKDNAIKFLMENEEAYKTLYEKVSSVVLETMLPVELDETETND